MDVSQPEEEINCLLSTGISNIHLNSSYIKFTPEFFQWMFL